MMQTWAVLVGDIGATNTRLALVISRPQRAWAR